METHRRRRSRKATIDPLAWGRSNREVAAYLFISPKTVGRHVENLYATIGVSSRAAAAVFAMQHRLLD